MRALLSVWDKTGIVEFARRLVDLSFEIVSTGGTLAALREAGIPARAVSDVTGFPEILGGRVKTLHPAIHGGLLARRDLPEQMAELAEREIAPIDLVAANLYPFGDVVREPGVSLAVALEHIDIGGPAMIRAAAKNFPSVLPVVDPADYGPVADEIAAAGLAGVTLERRRALAAKAFAHVAAYDSVVADFLRAEEAFPDVLTLAGQKIADLRYGENPHQRAAIYRQRAAGPDWGVATWRLLGGKEMSYNNYLDAAAAWRTASDFPDTTAAIVKHTVPCGVASDETLAGAFARALLGDPISAFGGIVAVNRTLDGDTASRIAERYFEVVLAPGYTDDALATLRRKKNLRLVQVPDSAPAAEIEVRALDGALLAQTPDRLEPDPTSWRVVTERRPTDEQWAALLFAWRVVRHVKSNAVALASGRATVGIGGGQPNRVDAVRIAIERAGERAAGSVLASDAFFPFSDNVEVAAAAGIAAIVQPGGSVRDAEVIEAANRLGVSMVFTGVRHFRH